MLLRLVMKVRVLSISPMRISEGGERCLTNSVDLQTPSFLHANADSPLSGNISTSTPVDSCSLKIKHDKMTKGVR